MVLLFLEQVFGDEQREIRVFMPCRLKARIKFMLHKFPHGVTVGFYDHAALNLGIVNHVGLQNDVRVPLRKIFGSGRDMRNEFFFLFCHCNTSSVVINISVKNNKSI